MSAMGLTPDEQKFVEVSGVTPEHVLSVKRAVGRGRHETLVYPASGNDVLRVLFAYNIGSGLFIDESDYFRENDNTAVPALLSMLQRAELPHKAVDRSGVLEIEADVNGRTRQITCVRKELDFSDHGLGNELKTLAAEFLGDEQVDILYTYWVYARRHTLGPETYRLIRPGGFYVTEEGDVPIPQEARRAAHTLLCLKPRRIVPRFGQKGVVYQKTAEADYVVAEASLALLFGNDDIQVRMRALGDFKARYDAGRFEHLDAFRMQNMGYLPALLESDAYERELSRLATIGSNNALVRATHLASRGAKPALVRTLYDAAVRELQST